jgi:deoxyribonuclease-4
MINACGKDERLGLCIDTQHLWASGFDFSTVDGAKKLVKEVDSRIGMDRLKCFHLNDSKIELGGNKDRHANIDEGTIGAKGLAALMGHPKIRNIPMLLEVPGDGDGPRAEDVKKAEKTYAQGLAMYGVATKPASSKVKSATKKAATKKAAPAKKPAAKKAVAKKTTKKK